MAKQAGQFPLSGTIGDVTMYISKEYGALAKMKGGPTREQVKQGKNYALTRLNNEEFGRASHYGRIIRDAFALLELRCKNARMNTNLLTRLREIMLMDKESKWGKRDLRRDTLASLTHFELDANNVSKQYFRSPVITKAANGCLEVTASITLGKQPENICKWELVSIAAAIDFKDEDRCTRDAKTSELFDYDKKEHAMSFNHYYDENKLLFYGMGILFYEYDAVNERYVVTRRRGVNSGFLRFVR